MSSIPLDVMETILLRLPAFDLVRCKAVCKAWRSLISSADFVGAHLERVKSDPSSQHILLHNCSFDGHRRVAGPFLSFACFSSGNLRIVGSVNGLLCIAGTPHRILSPDYIWILNPATGLSMKLPRPSRVFDDRRHNIKFAFWFDDDDCAYKVARILTNFYGKSTLELWVSTFPDSWTVISTFYLDLYLHPRRFHACDVLIQGLAAYWIVVLCDDDESDYESDYGSDYESGYDSDNLSYNGSDYGSDDEIVVVSLDLKTLALTRFAPLFKGELHMRNSYLQQACNGDPNPFLFGGNLNGEFVLVAYRYLGFDRVYDIWTLPTMMMDDATVSASWVKKYTIRFDSFRFDKGLGIVNDKLVLTSCGGMLVALCDPLTGMLEVIETGPKLKTLNVNSAHGFVGSLVSMDGFGFEWKGPLRNNMGISWPYSLHPSVCRNEEGCRMKLCKKHSRKEEASRMKSCKKHSRKEEASRMKSCKKQRRQH